MAYEVSKFGDANVDYDLKVHSHFGTRVSDDTVGVEHASGSKRILRVRITGERVQAADTFLPPVVLPKGARATKATLTVDEAFAGTALSVKVNNMELTQTELGSTGVKDITLAGDFAAALAAPKFVALTYGTNTGANGTGHAILYVEYDDMLIDPERQKMGDGGAPA